MNISRSLNRGHAERPIGIFDSGVGGLTVFKALRARLPGEHLLYLGDTARLPYGTKSAESVTRYALQAASHLAERGVKMLVIALQLADAYDIIADNGMHYPPTFVHLDVPPVGRRVIPARYAVTLRNMLETVVSDQGTGELASVAGYHVAGKTGTAHIAENGGYSAHNYMSVFCGMAPATDPRLVIVVDIKQPSRGQYYGGLVSAPVFARVMTGALRLLDIPPDDLGNLTTTAYVVNLGHAS